MWDNSNVRKNERKPEAHFLPGRLRMAHERDEKLREGIRRREGEILQLKKKLLERLEARELDNEEVSRLRAEIAEGE